MDDIDRQLIDALRANGRATFAELGRAVGLSPPTTHDRIHKLEAAGVITGYHAAVDPEAFGLGVGALVGLFLSDDHEADEVVATLRDLPQIEDCWFVAGDETLIIKVRVPDVDALELLLGELRRTPGIARSRTTVILSTRWEDRVRSLRAPAEPGTPAQPPAQPPAQSPARP